MMASVLILYLCGAAVLGATLGLGVSATLRVFKVRSLISHVALGALYGLILAFALSALFDFLGTHRHVDDGDVEVPILACVTLGIVSSIVVRLLSKR